MSERLPERLSRWLYAALLWLATPAYVLRLWRRGAAEPLYREAIGERLGLYRVAAEPGRLWVHAVSLGETRAAAPLIEALRDRSPGLRLLLTHSTATGREAARALLREGDAICWLPYDTPGATRRFLRHWRPRLGVLMETEIWPGLSAAARACRLPMVLANARLSERSARKGRRLAWLLAPAVRGLTLVLAQSEADARRLREGGARRVELCGNLKFDLRVDEVLLAQGRRWRERLGRPVLLGAVTREGEEAELLAAWDAARHGAADGTAPLLLIVPRHPQRFDEVAALVGARGLSLARRSRWQDEPDARAWQAQVWLGDSMREMALYYGLGDVALLGGSFAPLGGQNLIEAAACGCPVLMGPHTFNFAEAAELAEQAGAARRVADLPAAVDAALALCADAPQRARLARCSLDFAARHRGAAARMAERLLALSPPP